MIAKDVIAAATAEEKLFTSGGGGYLWFTSGYNDFKNVQYNNPEKDMRDYLTEKAPKCDVCAKGALFVCTLMRRDNVTLDTFDNIRWGQSSSSTLSNTLGNLFSTEQLNLIEAAYEQFTQYFPYEKIGNFDNYAYGTKRLIAIMKNIIKNQGTFIPEMG